MMRKKGLFLAVIGPDGSGKTTLVNLICRELEGGSSHTAFSRTYHMRSNFEILPKLSTVASCVHFRRSSTEDAKSKDDFQGLHSGMKQKPNSRFRSLIYIAWYSIDMILGRYIVRQAKSKGELVFFARYFYDYYYQRSNELAPLWYLKFFELLVPKPDMVFYIKRAAKDIYRLKPELSINEIERQQNIISKMALSRKNFVQIDGAFGVEKSKVEMINHIKRWLDQN